MRQYSLTSIQEFAKTGHILQYRDLWETKYDTFEEAKIAAEELLNNEEETVCVHVELVGVMAVAYLDAIGWTIRSKILKI